MHLRNGHVINTDHADNSFFDTLEPEVTTQDERLANIGELAMVMANAFGYIEAPMLRPGCTLTDVAVAFYQVAFAMGLGLCKGKSVTSVANVWGVERATISKGMVAFSRTHRLPPSKYMKDPDASGVYAASRKASITKCNPTN